MASYDDGTRLGDAVPLIVEFTVHAEGDAVVLTHVPCGWVRCWGGETGEGDGFDLSGMTVNLGLLGGAAKEHRCGIVDGPPL
jgi:hypothetical protein